MNKKVKRNNKGFSLVELIVVMAIMAILAVTLAPKLTQYIDKARQSNDREIPNAVYTAVKLGLLDENIQKEVADTTEGLDWNAGVDIIDKFYDRQNLETDPDPDAQLYKIASSAEASADLLGNEIIQMLGDQFRFQSNLAKSHSVKIVVEVSNVDKGQFTVSFEYDGTVTGKYEMKSSEALGD